MTTSPSVHFCYRLPNEVIGAALARGETLEPIQTAVLRPFAEGQLNEQWQELAPKLVDFVGHAFTELTLNTASINGGHGISLNLDDPDHLLAGGDVYATLNNWLNIRAEELGRLKQIHEEFDELAEAARTTFNGREIRHLNLLHRAILNLLGNLTATNLGFDRLGRITGEAYRTPSHMRPPLQRQANPVSNTLQTLSHIDPVERWNETRETVHRWLDGDDTATLEIGLNVEKLDKQLIAWQDEFRQIDATFELPPNLAEANELFTLKIGLPFRVRSIYPPKMTLDQLANAQDHFTVRGDSISLTDADAAWLTDRLEQSTKAAERASHDEILATAGVTPADEARALLAEPGRDKALAILWAREHGSARLKGIIELGELDNSMSVYYDERLAKELPGFLRPNIPMKEGTFNVTRGAKKARNLTEEDVELLKRAREYDPGAKLRYCRAEQPNSEGSRIVEGTFAQADWIHGPVVLLSVPLTAAIIAPEAEKVSSST